MLLPLLTIVVGLIAVWAFNAKSYAWVHALRESAPSPVLPNKQFSLWSIVLFIFFPISGAPPESKEFG
jgi:hypothetical protein